MHVSMELNEKGDEEKGQTVGNCRGEKAERWHQDINSEKLLMAKDGQFASSLVIKPTRLKYISYVYIYDLVILKITATNWSLLENHIFW